MPQTAQQYLDTVVSEWTPPDGSFDARRKYKAGIENRLDSRFGLYDMFETGSLRHGTGVRYNSNADYFAVMKGSRPTADTALLNVQAALQDKYPDAAIQVRKPAVKCWFEPGVERVEVIPAFPADGAGYWIPDPNDGGWMRSHPKNHDEYLNEANQKHSGAAKKLARLVKLWKYQHFVPVSSCYLEMRAAKYVNEQTSWVMYEGLHHFFESLQAIGLSGLNDPTGLGSRFNACSSERDKSDAISKLGSAIARAEMAMDYVAEGNHSAAIERYRLIFRT